MAKPEPLPLSEIARLFPQWEILRLIGRGGMGVVYLARQPNLDRFVALKILTPPEEDRGFAERFTREARTLAKLNHPCIVTVHDFGVVEGRYFLLMEYVDGVNLRELLQAQKIPPAEALAIVPRICEALQFAHEQGIVHRDIKPENILLDKQGRVKIADFGIAKLLASPEAGQAALTGAQDRVGTPHYMAPEQVEKPQMVDHRADIYSLGVVFYELLTGELPLGRFSPPSQRVQVDVRLDDVVLHALEKQPERRYQRASEVKAAVETIAATPPPSSAAAAAGGGATGGGPRAAAPVASGASVPFRTAEDGHALKVLDCVRRGWALIRSDPGPIVGITLVGVLLMSVSNSLVFGIANGPILGGLIQYYLGRIRGAADSLDAAWNAVKASFWELLVAGVLTGLVMSLGVLLPLFFLAVSHGHVRGALWGALVLLLPAGYLTVAWQFTIPLIVDRRLRFWTAMQLSRQIVAKQWWRFLGLTLVVSLPTVAAIVVVATNHLFAAMELFVVGGFAYASLGCATGLYAYEDIFGGARATNPSSGAGAPVSPVVPFRPRSTLKTWAWRLGVGVALFAVVGGAVLTNKIFIERRDYTVERNTRPDVPSVGRAVDLPMLDIARFVKPFSLFGEPCTYCDSFLGRQTIDGLPFQIDGAVVLSSLVMREKYGDVPRPNRILGVRIGTKFEELHVIHYCKFEQTETAGDEIARIRLNYHNGTSYDFPILYGGHVRDFVRSSIAQEELTDPNSRVIWRGPGPAPDPYRPPPSDTRLFKSMFRNPYPGEVVDSMDVISSQKPAAYCLVAATIAQHDPERPVTPLIVAR